jgi:hypothetical protein
MRRDRTAARILLILSVVHLAVAAPPIVRQKHLNVAKDVTPALGKRRNSDDDLPSTSGTRPGPPSQDGLPPTSGIPSGPSLDDTPPGSGTPQSQDDLPPTSGAPPHDDPPPPSGTSQLSDDPPPTPGAPLSQDDTSPVSGNPQSHNSDPPEAGWYSESPGPTSSDDLSWHNGNRHPSEETLRGESSEVPHLQHPPLLQQIDWNYFGETLHPEGEPLGESSGTSESSTTSGALQLQNDPPPASEDGSGEFDSSYRWLNDLRPIEGGSSSSESLPPPPPPPPSGPSGIVDTAFNDARKQKLKFYAGLGTIVGVSVGLVYGLQKLIKGTDPQAYVYSLFPPTFNQVTNNLTYDLP